MNANSLNKVSAVAILAKYYAAAAAGDLDGVDEQMAARVVSLFKTLSPDGQLATLRDIAKQLGLVKDKDGDANKADEQSARQRVGASARLRRDDDEAARSLDRAFGVQSTAHRFDESGIAHLADGRVVLSVLATQKRPLQEVSKATLADHEERAHVVYGPRVKLG